MISICIPVYNFDISNLVKAIEKQTTNVVFELVVIDDASDEVFKIENRKLLGNHKYVELPNNIGRSKIRNLFKSYVQYSYMLFMDCDSMIQNDDFLQKYANSLVPNVVVYGGRIYPDILPSKEQFLSWKYGIEVESKSVIKRNQEPYLSFMTNNFLIDSAVFEDIFFNEGIDTYGHEDTFFGYELAQNKIKIIHLENPVLNLDLETNERFFVKNETAIANLIKLQDGLFSNHVRLLSYYKKMNVFQKIIVKRLFNLTGSLIRKKMIAGFYSTKLLNFYKLGYLIKSVKN
ncbi:glycosyltransferase family 2 protein [Wenyingzhuangia aestuarii]|uniref:glycosyltransferase family 2 protein n=1 Tax=Wenyingzhuangia aestuarii TaxID=1647582 RepID=UPI00143BC30A|nr:glycosyltransferase family A protein [Wenyingzhuangia aestuarii]NJB81457.1 hypothetical protein [Wenyingzhuangia aestuarii]